MTEARIRYRTLPDWVKALIEPRVATYNETADPTRRYHFVAHERDVINMQITFDGVPEIRREVIREIHARLTADDVRYKDICTQIMEWFECGHSAIMTALHPEMAKRRTVKRAETAKPQLEEAA